MKNIKSLRPNDVVRIALPKHPTFGSETGVVNRVDTLTGMVNVFPKGCEIGIWFDLKHLKRIGGKAGVKRKINLPKSEPGQIKGLTN